MQDVVNTAGSQEHEPADPGVDLTRRGFVVRAIAAIGALIATIIGIPVAAFAAMPFFRARTTPELLPDSVPPTLRSDAWAPAGELDDFDVGEPRIVSLQREVSDAWVTGTAPVAVYVTRLTETEVVAYDIHCSHLGCPLAYSSGSGTFLCPCHGGSFDIQGEVVGGPPPRPMFRYATRVKDGVVEVGPLDREA